MSFLPKSKKSIYMLGLLLLLACIPREKPPEKGLVLKQIGTLPNELNGNSGMTEYDGLIWFINDNPDDTNLYGYNHELDSVVRKVVVRNAININWEEISQNENYIYIGDFGNNSGSRNDLRIIRINKSDLLVEKDTVTSSGIIEFSYEDQTDFTPTDQLTPFDCEAFITTEDSIILFTKDWQTQNTRIYSLPVTPGNYVAKFKKQWNVNGLITAAAWSAENQELLLLGYSTIVMPFLWIFSGFTPEDFTYDEGIRTDFKDFFPTQTEGILYSGDGSILISSEEFTEITSLRKPPALFTVEGQ
jgi:hypothetical protein